METTCYMDYIGVNRGIYYRDNGRENGNYLGFRVEFKGLGIEGPRLYGFMNLIVRGCVWIKVCRIELSGV